MPLRAAIVPVTPFQQNCSILWCDGSNSAAIVDPGGDLPRILAAIEKTGVTPEKILLTHGHIDHAGGAAELKERLGVPVEGPHRDDKFLLEKLVESGRKYGMVEARNLAPDRWLDEGDEVTVGELAFDVLHCPGHSPGSVVLVLRGEALCHRRRRAVPRLGRAHRHPRRRSRRAHRLDQEEAHAARRRSRLPLRPRPDEQHRRGARDKSVPALTRRHDFARRSPPPVV
jgi:Metallo-beta-lactamase superfamily